MSCLQLSGNIHKRLHRSPHEKDMIKSRELHLRSFYDYTWILLALVLPWSLALMQIALGLVCLGGAALLIFDKNSKKFRPQIAVFIGLYLAVRLLSAFFSPQPLRSITSIIQNDWVAMVILIPMTATLSSKTLRKVIHVLIFSASLAAVYGIVQWFSGIDLFRDRTLPAMGNYYRSTGGYNFYLTFAGNQLMVLAVVAAGILMGLKQQLPGLKYLIPGAVLILLSIMATFARSTWLALIVVAAVLTLMVDRRWFLGALAGILAVGIIASLISPEIATRLSSIADIGQNENRLNLWHTSWRMISDFPLLGIGPDLFNDLFPQYRVPGYYDAYGHAHNDYINVAVNSGFLGLLSWILLWGAWFREVLTGLRGSLNDNDRFVLLGSLAAISGILFAAIFQCYFTDLENNLLWWVMAAIGIQIVQRQRAQELLST